MEISDQEPKKKEIRLLMVGLDNSGKTTILNQWAKGVVGVTVPTIGFLVEVLSYEGLLFTIYDLGGADKILLLKRQFYAFTDGFIFVADSSDKDRLDYAQQELTIMLEAEESKHVPLLVMANKQDQQHALTLSQMTDQLKLFTLRERKWHVQGTYAITGQGLKEALDWIINAITKD